MQILCPRCSAPLQGADMDLAHGRAVCRPCGELVLLPSNEALVLAPSRAAFRPTDLRSRELTVGDQRGLMVMPARGTAALETAFAGAWLAMLWSVFHAQPPVLAFASVFGAALLFLSLRRLINTGRLTVDRARFRFRRGPLPDAGAVDEPTDNVLRFEACQQASRWYDQWSWGRKGRVLWGVALLTLDGRRIELRLDLASEAQADWVAARLGQLLEEARAPAGYRG